MEYALTVDLKWLYLKEDNKLPYDTFSIIDEHGFIVARDIQEEEVAVSSSDICTVCVSE